MTSRDSDVQKTGISSENFSIPTINPTNYYQTSLRFTSHNNGSVETLHKILKRLAGKVLPGKDHIEAYLRHLTAVTGGPGHYIVISLTHSISFSIMI